VARKFGRGVTFSWLYSLKSLNGAPPGAGRSTTVKEGLDYCYRLFAIERKIKGLSAEGYLNTRLNDRQPVLDDFWAWLKEQRDLVTPKSATGMAISSLNQWPKLITIMKEGRVEIDNNRAERSIKPFVIGRNCILSKVMFLRT